MKIYRDASTLSAAQKKKLLAIKEEGGGGRLQLPQAINYLPDRYHDYDSAGTNIEEVNDNSDTVDCDGRDTVAQWNQLGGQ